MTPEIMIMELKKKKSPRHLYVLGTWTFTGSLNPCQPCERTDLIATFYLLTKETET